MNFKGRKLVIATMHHKEKVIAPVLENLLGVKCVLAGDINTDLFGTFSGEIQRNVSPLEALRAKCTIAMEQEDCDLAIASEGSFGCHPSYFFTQADDELVLFVDRRNELEIIERELSLDTNLNASYITNEKALLDFAKKSKFPSHGLILKDQERGFSFLEKGITSKERLLELFNSCMATYGSAYLETDMRAMFNPSRMNVIKKATEKLCEKIKSKCPNCLTPGFSVQRVLSGLPCSSCFSPTKSTKAFIYQCSKCLFEVVKEFPNEKRKEDPMYCDFCNP